MSDEKSPSTDASVGDEAESDVDEIEEEDKPPLPWSIKVLGLAFAAYLLLRIVQMVGWLIRWMTG